MYSRAARNVVQLVGSTPKQVGPGSYEVDPSATCNDFKKPVLDSYAPFLSLSIRDDIFAHLNETPGLNFIFLTSEFKYAGFSIFISF